MGHSSPITYLRTLAFEQWALYNRAVVSNQVPEADYINGDYCTTLLAMLIEDDLAPKMIAPALGVSIWDFPFGIIVAIRQRS